jgi:ABC-2 type transport system ATP-binding protein
MHPADPVIRVEDVCKRYGNHQALTDISLTIPSNTIYGLLGPNGAGKTSLIRIINQITYPDSGRIFFEGEPLAPEHIGRIGYLPEERGLYKGMRVGEQALYLAQLKGLSKSEARRRLMYWFEKLEIGDWWNKKILELSKGMAQKIQFIVTVLHEPRLLIFDEPFSGFDPINAQKIKDEILELKDNGASIIFSTHRMESVEELCEHIALIHNSEKLLEGRLSEIKKEYRKNEFAVVLHVESEYRNLLGELEERFEIDDARYIERDGLLQFQINLPCPDTREVLHYLSDKAAIQRFEELIPTANDIFIQTVQSEGGHE